MEKQIKKPNKPKRPKVKFKKEVRVENGREVTILHPLPPEGEKKKKGEAFPGKNGYIKTAKELYYPAEIIERLKKSTTEREAECLMAEGRRSLDRFDYGQKDYGKYNGLDEKCGSKQFINKIKTADRSPDKKPDKQIKTYIVGA